MSFVIVRLTPTVAHADGLSRMAIRRRPSDRCRVHTTTMPTMQNSTVTNSRYAGVLRERRCRTAERLADLPAEQRQGPGSAGRPARTRRLGEEQELGHPRRRPSSRTRGRGPASRTAGPAIKHADRHGERRRDEQVQRVAVVAPLTSANAPQPARVICASEIWLAQPVSGTSDIMMNAVSIASVTSRTCSRLRTAGADERAMNRTAKPNSARSHRRQPFRVRARAGPAGDAAVRHEEHRDEQDDAGIAAGGERPAPGPDEEVLLEREREPDDEAADVGHRQAAQPGDDACRERIDDEQRQRRRRRGR